MEPNEMNLFPFNSYGMQSRTTQFEKIFPEGDTAGRLLNPSPPVIVNRRFRHSKTPPQNTRKNLSKSLSKNYAQLVTLYTHNSVPSKHISDVSCNLFTLHLP